MNPLALVQWIVHRASTSRIWVRFLYAGPLLFALTLPVVAKPKKSVEVREPARAVLIFDRSSNKITEEKNIYEAMPIAGAAGGTCGATFVAAFFARLCGR